MRLTCLIVKVRSHRIAHYIVVFASAFIILFLYYAYQFSMHNHQGNWLDWFWTIFLFEFRTNFEGLLLGIPILYSALTLGWKRSSIVISALLICIIPYILMFSFHIYTPFVSFAALIIPAMIVIVIELELESRAKDRRVQAEKENQRMAFLRQTFKAQEDERKRIAQELHDGIIQTLLVNASVVRDLLLTHPEKPLVAIEKNLKMIETNTLDMANDIRRVCRDLSPSILDNLGLVPAIRWVVDHLYEETGIKVSLSLEGSLHELTSEENIALFRLIQETLNNIRRHSKATTVDVSIMFLDSNVSIEIKDNGRGFHLPKNIHTLASTGKLGIIGMYERAQSIGANLQIDSKVGLGTMVKILLERNKVGLPSLVRTELSDMGDYLASS